MSHPLGVRFVGPLAPFANGLAGELAGLGYAPATARTHLELWAQLSGWLAEQGLEPGQLVQEVIDRFLLVRRGTHAALHSLRALRPGLEFLRRTGVVPEAPSPVASTLIDVVLDRFRAYLRSERGVLEATAQTYAQRARPFLVNRVRDGGLDLESLTAGDISAFAARWLPGLSQSSAKSAVTAWRSLLRFLHVSGQLARPLVAAVPTAASWRLAGLPIGLDARQVSSLLGACDRGSAVGRRDFAVVSMLARLGLRSAEVSALSLSDIDWRAGTLRIHGKGNRHELLPLPVDVGSALSEYLQQGRPAQTSVRAVFLTARAPYRALNSKSVGTLVARAARRAGLGIMHAHRLRHTVATATLAAGAPLVEVGQLLRHSSSASTAIYAKVDHRRLAELARPWPTPAGQR
ncbi:MAG: tyrosine-type recombinase/integrase [Pseudonocardiales bacterium]|nr:tyrosine-type recombinase/integrase [Pseudonocardiales bacterium]